MWRLVRSGSGCGAGRRIAASAFAAALIASVVVAPPAAAIHQACGAGYPSGTLSTGHPDLDAAVARPGWSGTAQLFQLEQTAFALSKARQLAAQGFAILAANSEIGHAMRDNILNPKHFEKFHPPHKLAAVPFEVKAHIEKAIAIVNAITATILFVAETAAQASLMNMQLAVGKENTCNSVLGGDMIDNLWIALVERNLASAGPPLAILLLPHDSQRAGTARDWPLMPQHEESDFPWCPAIELPRRIPRSPETGGGGGDAGGDRGDGCPPAFHTGFLDAPSIGVKDVVEDVIGHATGHGLDVRAAQVCYDAAVADLEASRYKGAFEHFRLAYQWATSVAHPSTAC